MATHTELVITRTFDAPRELVWKALTEFDRLAEWWGPKGFAWLGGTLDLRPGGVFHYGMGAPGGGPQMWGKFVYKEIVPPNKLVFINSFADASGNTIRAPFSDTWPLEVHNTWTLDERDGKTTLTLRGYPHNATQAERDTFESMRGSMQQGFAGTFDQLADYLARA
jgi:uncharacterized protein YndB with AHSA1/START domain